MSLHSFLIMLGLQMILSLHGFYCYIYSFSCLCNMTIRNSVKVKKVPNQLIWEFRDQFFVLFWSWTSSTGTGLVNCWA
uniref:Uncharacterized protein n=1 Tax=Octopus bimaculoides TaxID=37653 RepID=A0A0L8GKS0_OCTBM